MPRWIFFPSLDLYLVEAPAKAGHHGNCKGGLEGLVRELHPLGGDHEAFVVSSGGNLDFNIAKVQLKSSWCNSPLFLRMKPELSLMIPHAISLKTFITTSENCNISNNSWVSHRLDICSLRFSIQAQNTIQNWHRHLALQSQLDCSQSHSPIEFALRLPQSCCTMTVGIAVPALACQVSARRSHTFIFREKRSPNWMLAWAQAAALCDKGSVWEGVWVLNCAVGQIQNFTFRTTGPKPQ